MPNRLTKGKGIFGGVLFSSGGKAAHTFKNTVARTDTSAKTLFSLPANFTITRIAITSAAASNAGTTATLSVGKSGGTGTEYLNGLDVKGSSGSGQQNPTAAVLGSVGTSAVTVTGIYAETGTGSSAGGPWTVIVEGIPA